MFETGDWAMRIIFSISFLVVQSVHTDPVDWSAHQAEIAARHDGVHNPSGNLQSFMREKAVITESYADTVIKIRY